MIEDVNERNEREICEYGRVLTEDERRELGARDAKADASAAELRAEREQHNRAYEEHKESTGHYPTPRYPAEPCLYCKAAAAKAKADAKGEPEPVQLHGDAIECPHCKHVMLKAEIADYRAHGQECMAYEIRTRRNEATISELAKRLVAAELHADRLEKVIMETGQERQHHDLTELKVSLLALARYVLEPGECLAPDSPMYCGGSDLCPCRTDGHFSGTCLVTPELVKLLNEHIDKHPGPWRYHKANEGREG